MTPSFTYKLLLVKILERKISRKLKGVNVTSVVTGFLQITLGTSASVLTAHECLVLKRPSLILAGHLR